MLRQYFEAKEEHPGVLLAMRVGDFYEFYGADAEVAAGALEITLTGREDGENGRIPMAGVPYHAVEKYLAKLVQKGLKVALCDQLEDPKAAKGLVRRGVTRVLTPGTVIEEGLLPGSQNNFLVAVCGLDSRVGMAILDPSTGEFSVTEVAGNEAEDRILQELARLRPPEVLVGPGADSYGEAARLSLGSSVSMVEGFPLERAQRRLQERFEVKSLAPFGCEDMPAAISAAAMILAYADKNKLPLSHVEGLASYSLDSFMRLDLATRRSLELTQNLGDGSKRLTLLSVLDETVTPMGSRLLRRWIEQPLLETSEIIARQEAVGRLVANGIARGDIRDRLRRIADVERLASRAAAGIASPRDLVGLRLSLGSLPELDEPLCKVGLGRLQDVRERIGDHTELYDLLEKALVAEPPYTLREGGIFRSGHDLELDKLRDLAKNGKRYIAELEAKERERSGISTLKVGFNAVFGYYIEVSKSNLAKVPEEYIRRQTTANAERYITAELKEHESLVLGAEEKSLALEADLFNRLRARVAEHTRALHQTARALAELDALSSFAEAAVRRDYSKPTLVAEDELEYTDGRHPVVESNAQAFVPNDLALGDTRLMILTGPNMSGKSTFLRQTALIVLMAQIGSFVPAKTCRLCLHDRIFARIGAKDELAMGQSTFMVEMVESANILNHATGRSLVILDEIGRGTSTYDGLAIAWAMAERLAAVGAKTMFATHYHQLNALADQIPGVANFRVSVEELGDDIVWTHRVLPGGTDRSYGLHVARMAGVPPGVLERAADILGDLEGREPARAPKTERLQLTLFEAEEAPVVKELQKLDVNVLTPLEALRLLDEWKRKFGVRP